LLPEQYRLTRDCTMTTLPFRDRSDAARQLARALAHLRDSRPLVLAIPRGAVPMGRIVAEALGGELDIVLVRKLGAPGHPELAIGAVDESGWTYVNEFAPLAAADADWIERSTAAERAVMRERRRRYAPDLAQIDPRDRTVIVIDDGLATGATMIAALHALRARKPARLVCAVPVAATDSIEAVRRHADEVVCLATPEPFGSVGQHYLRFDQVDDEEVIECLRSAKPPGPAAAAMSRAVAVDGGGIALPGDLALPLHAKGLVVFAHGSGSSRLSPRNRAVAATLEHHGFATLLFDLLTADEDRDRSLRFDIALLSTRLEASVTWAHSLPELRRLRLGLFGASTGAASALEVAARQPAIVAAVVSRGGRPDLASDAALARVRAPVMLIVGERDVEVLALNRAARDRMHCPTELAIVPNATHLFEEPGALDSAAQHAARWFSSHLATEPPTRRRRARCA
jgi:predicted phosphoribosyltransferase/dienelactone hydrolase